MQAKPRACALDTALTLQIVIVAADSSRAKKNMRLQTHEKKVSKSENFFSFSD